MEFSTRTLSILAIIGVGVVLVVLMLSGNFAGRFTEAADPVQVNVVIETTPTPTPFPTIPPPTAQVVRLAQQYDGRATLADREYQGTANAYTATEFAGHDAVSAAGNVLTIPACDIGAPPPGSASLHVYPWTRYAIAWPASQPQPTGIVFDGLVDWTADFVLQETRATESDPWLPKVLAIGGTDYNLVVTADRHDCRLLEGHRWSLHN